jgi:hypothetical protein
VKCVAVKIIFVINPLIITVKVITTRHLLKESFVELTAVLLNKDEDGNEVRPRMDIYHPQLNLPTFRR